MVTIDGVNYFKIGEVSKIIERSPLTIKNWYEYADKVKDVDLPQYFNKLDKKGSRYWKEEDIPKLIAFRDSIERGTMRDFNVNKWGKDRANKITRIIVPKSRKSQA